ncbi:MAG TPA: hypothetical protein VNG90_00205, partial [Candidatus Acidoferrum sp.]|nr:hypothetical protein [Candidatus Acidoferrum sp.]
AVSGWDVWEAAFLAMADLTYIPNEPTLPQSSVGELRLRLEPELSKAYAVMAPPQGSIQVTKHKPGPQDLPGVLASERRHTGTIATVRATGSPEAVRAALQACLTERLALQIQ